VMAVAVSAGVTTGNPLSLSLLFVLLSITIRLIDRTYDHVNIIYRNRGCKPGFRTNHGTNHRTNIVPTHVYSFPTLLTLRTFTFGDIRPRVSHASSLKLQTV
jgi:hypothetical protein